MSDFFSGRNKSVGIDIGFNTVKVVELVRHGKTIAISNSNMVGIPPASISKNGFVQKEKIALAITQALSTAQPKTIKTKHVITALPESLIFSKIINLSAEIPPKQIEEAVLLQISDLLPWPAAETYFDWKILPIRDPKTNERKIFVAASAKQLVDDLVSIMNLAKLNLISIETKPIAASRALISIKDKDPIILIDVGAAHSSASVIDEGIIQFSSTIPVGANLVVNKENSQNLTMKEIQKIAVPLIENVQNNISYFNTRLKPGGKISQIRLCGGGSNITGLEKAIEEVIKIKTIRGDASINFHTRLKYDPVALQIFTVAIGLAMRGYIE